jgi:hypothetical protein
MSRGETGSGDVGRAVSWFLQATVERTDGRISKMIENARRKVHLPRSHLTPPLAIRWAYNSGSIACECD